MNIYQKLIEVRKVAPYLKKENQSTQYKYVSSSQVLQTLKTRMDELQLLLIPKITGHNIITETIEYTDTYKGQSKPKKTTTYFTELEMEFTWVNAENPEETIVCPWYGQGVDIAGEKGVGKALTYAEKYFMLKFFNIATDKDDPDAQPQENGNGASKPQTKTTSEAKPKQQTYSKKETVAQNGTPMATQGQIKAIQAAADKAGLTMDVIKETLDRKYDVQAIADLTHEEAKAFIMDLQKGAA